MKIPKPPTKKCIQCGKKFIPPPKHFYKKYCSARCRYQHHKEHGKKYIPKKNPFQFPATFVCQHCGEKIPFLFKGRKPKELLLDSLICPKCKKTARY